VSQSIIRAKLMTTLAAYAAAHSPVLTIARENTAFNKPTDGSTFLEAMIFPANTIIPVVSGERRRFLGDFQVNIWTRQGVGAGTAETIAEEISQLFKVFPKELMPVSIEAPARIKKAVEDVSQWWVTPVLISYRMESEN
jgi:hypothetical protein